MKEKILCFIKNKVLITGTMLLGCCINQATAQCAATTGTRTVGPTGNYTTLGTALTDLSTNGFTGSVVLELQPDFASASETYPVIIPPMSCITGNNTITIRPAATVTTPILISGDTALIYFNGAKNVVIDGRAGGTGSVSMLTLNSSESGTVRFLNEAQHDTLRYVNLTGNFTGNTFGLVYFTGSTGTEGNSYNTVANCIFNKNATGAVGCCIASNGTAGKPNKYNAIVDNQFVNFYGATSLSFGINIRDNSSNWLISNNSFFQTSANAVNLTIKCIKMSVTDSMNIRSNYIGGNAPFAAGTWASNTTATSNTQRIVGISLEDGGGDPAMVDSNIIKGFNFPTSYATTTAGGCFAGIYVEGTTSARIGVNDGNLIGSMTTNDVIKVINSANMDPDYYSAGVHGIAYVTSGNLTIANNKIGGMSIEGNSNSRQSQIAGILNISGVGTATIQNNIIGGNLANSIRSGTITTSGRQSVTGIRELSASAVTISGNTVRNLSAIGNGTSNSLVQGIQSVNTTASSSVDIIENNTIYGLYNSTGNGCYGIKNENPNVIIRYNNIHDLVQANSNGTAGDAMHAGIYNTNTSGSITMAYNTIQRLFRTGTAPNGDNAKGTIAGIAASTNATLKAHNNTILLDSAGTALSKGATVTGIRMSTNNNQLYNNIVKVNAATPTAACLYNSVISISTPPTATLLSANNNSYYINPANANYIYIQGSSMTSPGKAFINCSTCPVTSAVIYVADFNNPCSEYKQFISNSASRENASFLEDVPFTGGSTIPDNLKPNPTGISYALNGGMPLGYTTDALNAAVDAVTPDVGAIEFSTGTLVDGAAPAITYSAATTLPNTANTCVGPMASITITDAGGVNNTTGMAPRIWYKKGSLTSGNQNILPATNDNTTDGWKWIEANNTSSPYSFTIDYGKISGGVASGDTIYYFVAAQDNAGNVGSNAVSYATGYCPASVALDAAAFPLASVTNKYVLLPHPATAVATASSTSACMSGTTTLSTTAPPSGDNVQWQSAPSGTSTWVNIAGATGASYTTGTLTSDTDFRCIISDCANNMVATSNTIAYSVTNPQITSITHDTICPGTQATLQAVPNTGEEIKWYAGATGGTALATGNSFTTPVLNSTTNYYAEAFDLMPAGSAGRGGNPNSVGSGPPSASGQGIRFNALTNLSIDSVGVWVRVDTGTVVVELQNSSNSVLQTNTFTFANAGGTTATPAKVYLPVNYLLNAGNDYKILGVGGTVPLVRENNVNAPFSTYKIDNVFTMVSSWLNGAESAVNYYYFYDFYVSTICAAPRQTVTATVTNATVDVTAATPAMNCGDATAVNITSNQAVTWTMENGNLYSDAASNTAYTTGTATTDVYAKAVNNRYVKGTYTLDGCMFTDSILITVNNPSVSTALSGINMDSTIVSGAATHLHNGACELMASVMPTGGTPVNGWLTGNVFIDGSVQNTVTGPYVTRHFELTPKANTATSNATVTLYFTQAEFDAYNTYVTNNGISTANPLLPSTPAGSTADILVDKFNAASGNPSPSNNNSVVAITPTSVTWDAANSWWAVTFPTAGFSGFFLHTSSTGTPLPIVWSNVSATLNRQKQAVIKWTVAEKDAAGYNIQKSIDGNKFENLATVNSKGNGNNVYSFTEQTTLSGKAWYRIAQVSKDGKNDYSKIMELQNSSLYGTIKIYPNPATQVLTVETEANASYSIYDLQGKVVMKGNLQSGKNTLHVSGLAKGFYTVKIGDYNQKIVLQ